MKRKRHSGIIFRHKTTILSIMYQYSQLFCNTASSKTRWHSRDLRFASTYLHTKSFKSDSFGNFSLTLFIKLFRLRLSFSKGETFDLIHDNTQYEDPLYFSRFFRKIKGMSPSDYQKLLKSNTNNDIEKAPQ